MIRSLADLLFVFNHQNHRSSSANQSSTSTSAATGETLADDDEDDDLDIDELNELEASLSKTSLHINEQGAK